MNISASLLKDFDDVKNGTLCGLLFEGKYITKTVEWKPTAAQDLGNWFEYLATGQKPRNGETPIPGLYAKKDPTPWIEAEILPPDRGYELPKILEDSFGDLKSGYQLMYKQAKKLRQALKYYKIEQIKTGVVWECEIDGIKTKAILDIRAIKDGRPCTIDIKSTAMLDNRAARWELTGWDIERAGGREKLMKQAKVYQTIEYELNGRETTPFFYFVYSSNDMKAAIFEVKVGPETIEATRNEIRFASEMINLHNSVGWNEKPTYIDCLECPLREKCPHKITVPQIHEIHL